MSDHMKSPETVIPEIHLVKSPASSQTAVAGERPSTSRIFDGAIVERAPRAILLAEKPGKPIDQKVVRFEYYNNFNYSMIAESNQNLRLTTGITSANKGEGKTLTASNLATSLALAHRKKTILVDFNFHSPKVHEIFGTPSGPGLLDALRGADINIIATKVDNLYVLPAGTNGSFQANKRSPIGVEHTHAFGEVVRTLEEQFEFVIIDMPAFTSGTFPVLFVNHLNGLLVVVEIGKTRRQDIDKMFRTLNKSQVLGFVFNKVPDDH
jgi:Mrp family chromosome partitioning ATPase